jgi:hypothetical protein
MSYRTSLILVSFAILAVACSAANSPDQEPDPPKPPTPERSGVDGSLPFPSSSALPMPSVGTPDSGAYVTDASACEPSRPATLGYVPSPLCKAFGRQETCTHHCGGEATREYVCDGVESDAGTPRPRTGGCIDIGEGHFCCIGAYCSPADSDEGRTCERHGFDGYHRVQCGKADDGGAEGLLDSRCRVIEETFTLRWACCP